MILLLDDNPETTRNSADRLRRDGFSVTCFSEGMEAYDSLKNQLYDLFVLHLDAGEDLSGWELLQLLKRCFPSTPILATCDCQDEKSILRAYHYGCHEFIKPPLYADELLFRVRYLLGWREVIHLPGGLHYLPDDHRLFSAHREIELTSSEKRLLHLLIQNMGKVVTADVIEEVLWEEVASEACRHTLISRVRKKLGKDVIKTLPKVGYTIDTHSWPESYAA
jgi:DNA-binding response OmpR family regulator